MPVEILKCFNLPTCNVLAALFNKIIDSLIEVNGPRRMAQSVGNAMHIGKKPQAKNEWERILPIVARQS